MSKTEHVPDHCCQLAAINRLEGQVRGIKRMVQQRKYCVDILTQVHAAIGALARIEDTILERHLETCVKSAVSGKSEGARQKKLNEIIGLLHKTRKL